jgi:hypothetical protein
MSIILGLGAIALILNRINHNRKIREMLSANRPTE